MEAPRAVSARWTVREPGSVAPPSSDDYASWTVAQLRKECTSRRLRLTRATPAAERVRLLQALDARREADERHAAALSTRSLSEHAGTRLANVLFSDAFSRRLAVFGVESEKNENWESGELDEFWVEVADEFNRNAAEHGQLVSDSCVLEGVDAGLVVPHDAKRLKRLWESMTRQFLRATRHAQKQQWRHPTQQHQDQEHDVDQDEFFSHCHGSVNAFYLHEWLQVKPEMLPVVERGVLLGNAASAASKRVFTSTGDRQNGTVTSMTDLQEAEISSASNTSSQEPKTKRSRQDQLETVTTSNTSKTEVVSEQSTIDELLKLHQLIGFLEDRIDQRRATDSQCSVESLEMSLELYRRKVAKLEDAYREAM